MKITYYTLLIIFFGSTLCSESWYSPYLQKIRSYFNPTTFGYTTVGAAVGGYVAHRADLNPCEGAACGLLLGLSAEKLRNLYAHMRRSESTKPKPDQTASPQKAKTEEYTPPHQTIEQTKASMIPVTDLSLQNPQKFHSDYQTIKNAVFARFSDSDFENYFNTKYRQATVDAVIELASHFDAVPRWSETSPVSTTISIDGKKIALTGDIANIIHNNQDAIIALRQSYLE